MKKVLITALVVLGLILAVSCSTNYTVKYMDGTTVYKTQTVPAGGLATEPVEPTKEGAVFGGWYKEAECINAYDFNTKVNSSFNLYAKWTVVPVTVYYTVTFETNGGAPVPAAQKVAKGEYAKVPEIYPVRAGFAFTGWYADEECKTLFGFEKTPILKDTTIYGGWKEIPVDSFAVTFNTNGGTPVPAVQIVKLGELVECPSPNPSKIGYSFVNWYSDAACTKVFDFNTTKITANTVIYAKWQSTAVSSYVVSFDVRGGEPTTIASQTVVAGGSASMPIPVPTKTGYDFYFWATEDGEQYSFGTEVYSDIKLHAVWSEGNWDNFEVLDSYIIGIKHGYIATIKSTGRMVIPDGIKGIADGTDCSVLEDYEWNGYDVYNELKEIELPASLEYIGDNAFRGFNVLESIKVRKAPSTKGLKALDEDVNKRAVNINAKTLGKDILRLANKVYDVYLSEATAIGEGAFEYSEVRTLEAAKVVSVDKKAFTNGTNTLTQLIVPSVTKASQIAGGEALEDVDPAGLVLVVSKDAEPAYNFTNTSKNVRTEGEEVVFNVYNQQELENALNVDNAKVVLCADVELTAQLHVDGTNVELDLGKFIVPYGGDESKRIVVHEYDASLVVKVYNGTQLSDALKTISSNKQGDQLGDIKIVLQDDVEVESAIDLRNDIGYTLDLNGFTIKDKTSSGFMFNVFQSKLVVTGKGCISASAEDGSADDNIFTIKGSENAGDSDKYGIVLGADVEIIAHDSVAVIQYSGTGEDKCCYGVTVDIYSKKITCGGELVDVVSDLTSANCNAEIVIHDGVCVTSKTNVLEPGGYADFTIGEVTFVSDGETIKPSKCKMSINGGTFVSVPNKDFPNACVALALPSGSVASVTVNNGTFTGTKAIKVSSNDASITIYNGTFNGEINNTAGALDIYGGTFSDLTGLNYCKSGRTYTLGGNVENAKALTINTAGVDVTVDLGGYTYTVNKGGSDDTALTFDGSQKLTIKNGTINASKDNLATGTNNIKSLLDSSGDLTILDVTFDGSNLYGNTKAVIEFADGESSISESGDGKAVVIAGDGVTAVGVTKTSLEANPVLTINNGTFGSVSAEKVKNLTISGGTYANDVSSYVDKAYKVTESSTTPATWTVTKRTSSDPNEAVIGDSYYATLEDAIASAVAGDTIELTKDVDFTVANSAAPGRPYKTVAEASNDVKVLQFANGTFSKGIVLDLKGKTITTNNCSVMYQGNYLTIENGYFVCKNGGSYALFIGWHGGTGSDLSTYVTLKDLTCTGGINVYNSTDVTIKSSTVSGTKYYAVWSEKGSTVTIEGGEYTSACSAYPSSALLLFNTNNDVGSFTVKGGTFTAPTGGTVFDSANTNIKVEGGTFSDLSGTLLCVDGAIYKLANDIDLESGSSMDLPLTSGEALAFVIDLNGKTIKSEDAHAISLGDEYLTLTLTNSATSEGYVSGVKDQSSAAVISVSDGTLIVDKGVTVSSSVDDGIVYTGGTIRIDGAVNVFGDNNDALSGSDGGSSDPSVTVNGTVSSEAGTAIVKNDDGVLTISGKVFGGDEGIVADGNGSISINDGAEVRVADTADYVLSSTEVTISISGGEFEGVIYPGMANFEINGGTFSSAKIEVDEDNESYIKSRLNNISLKTESSTEYSWTSAKDGGGYYHVGAVVPTGVWTTQTASTYDSTSATGKQDAMWVKSSTADANWTKGDKFVISGNAGLIIGDGVHKIEFVADTTTHAHFHVISCSYYYSTDGGTTWSGSAISSGTTVVPAVDAGKKLVVKCVPTWAVDEGYWKVEYNDNDAKCGGGTVAGMPAPATIAVNKTSSSLALAEVPTVAGYTCDGWVTTADGTTLVDNPYNVQADTVLYAHWVQDQQL